MGRDGVGAVADTPKRERLRALLGSLGNLQDPPPSGVITVAMAVMGFLAPYSDSGSVDSGFGFGESHLDFWMDGKAIRLIIKSVPELDQI